MIRGLGEKKSQFEVLRGTFKLNEFLLWLYWNLIFTSSNWYKRAQNRNCIFFQSVLLMMSSCVWMRPCFGKFCFAHYRKKGFFQKKKAFAKNLITISMNYMLTPICFWINRIIFSASAKKRTNYLADSLWENQTSLKWFPQSGIRKFVDSFKLWLDWDCDVVSRYHADRLSIIFPNASP